MTENEKIELFDKWYDENYDEWAEGEEGIALREELEQAFKGGIAELEEKISVLLSCKKCPENKGGFICQKEYEDKCLAQKIEYIKELQEENAELKNKLEHRNCLDCVNHSCMLRMKTLELEKECAKAKVFIRSLKSLIEDVCDINYLSKDNTRLLVEAEQFLNC